MTAGPEVAGKTGKVVLYLHDKAVGSFGKLHVSKSGSRQLAVTLVFGLTIVDSKKDTW